MIKKELVVLSGLVFSFPLLFASLVAAKTPERIRPTPLVKGGYLRDQAQPGHKNFRVIVNSNRDGAIAPDAYLTLREAIEIVNGTLPLDKLSQVEKESVKSLAASVRSQIAFNLPTQQTTIQLTDILPPLATPGVVVDGTTQLGYKQIPPSPPWEGGLGGSSQHSSSLKIPTPVIAITPAPQVEIFRGLTVVADDVTIRGLSLYGFTSKPRTTVSTPPADIFIADEVTAAQTSQKQATAQAQSQVPPKDVVIENNCLGIPPDSSDNKIRSAFGVSVFNSLGTTIRQNRIANHDGSGIITGKKAEDLRIINNIIEHNGYSGMPDAIRLEGIISNSEITSNLIQDNAGSAIYTFKPEGSVLIRNNNISNNGTGFQQAAIYLMGNDHAVINNIIRVQTGSGVVVAAYPQSRRNRIQGNQFGGIAGLAIDLVTQQNVSPQDYQQGDGANPPTDSYQRRRKTGNFGIDAPKWLSREFLIIDPKTGVRLDGVAQPGSQVEIYRSGRDAGTQELIGKPIATVNVNQKGRFSIKLGNLKPGDRVSAIATHPQYGTSEPAINAAIGSLLHPISHP